MPPRRQYTDSEMMRMQQDAVERVREMQRRAQGTAEPEGEQSQQAQVPPGYNGRNFRNWSTNPNVQRSRGRQRTRQEQAPPPPPPTPDPDPVPDPIPVIEQTPAAKTTLVQDILGAIGLDDDRLLIIGLLFILINAKADTTLILALIYLLL